MLEILLLMQLAKRTSENAKARGKSGGIAIAYTIVLWFVGEIGGFILGAFLMQQSDNMLVFYAFALGGAAAGAAAALALSKIGEAQYDPVMASLSQGMENIPLVPLAAPCQVIVTRESAFVGALAKLTVVLNGQVIGPISNGQSLQATTCALTNHVSIAPVLGGLGQKVTPYVFDAPAGGSVQVFLKAGKFLPEKTIVTPGAYAPAPGYEQGYAPPMPGQTPRYPG